MKLTYRNVTRTKTGYDVEIPLLDNESVMKLNHDTGEIESVELPAPTPQSGKHPDLIVFEPDAIFAKTFPAGWKWLYINTTPLEYKVASYLSHLAHPVTNSLKPLSDSTTQRELAYELNISKGAVPLVINKLFTLGVFGKFEVHEDKEYKKYWLFNPYLVFRGKYLQQSVWDLFKDTTIAKVYYAQKSVPCADC